MNICYVLTHFYPFVGGGEQFFLDLISEITKDNNVHVRVVTCNSGIKGHHTYNNIDIYSYDWKIMFGHPVVKAKDVEEHVKWADIVHTAIYTPVNIAIKLGRKYHKPVVTTVYEALHKKWFWIEPNIIKACGFYSYERFILTRKSDYFHVISNATKSDLKIVNKKAKANMIYCISEIDSSKVKKDHNKLCKLFNISNDSTVYLNYGRPGKTKGLYIYIKAIKKLVDENNADKLKNIKFCFIMGNDPMSEKKKYFKYIKKHNLNDYIKIVNPVEREDLKVYIKSADYIVIPSVTEGFGLSAIEACESKVPLIHSSGGSLPEVVYGLTKEFKNRDVLDLKDALEDSINNGTKNFKKSDAKDFSRKTISEQFKKYYSDILSKKND